MAGRISLAVIGDTENLWCAFSPSNAWFSKLSVPYYGTDLRMTVYANEEFLRGADVGERMRC